MPSTRRFITKLTAGATVAVVLAGIAPALEAQWPVRLDKRLPLTPDDKVDMNAKPLRTADGKVDLSGFWMPTEIVKHLLRLDADLKPGELPLNAKGQALLKDRIDWNGKDHPGAR